MNDLKSGQQEPSLESLLSDPICIAVMRCYGLEPDAVQKDMLAARARLHHLRCDEDNTHPAQAA